MDKKKLTLVSLAHFSCDINGGALPAALPYLRAANNLDYQATAGLMLAFSCLSSIIQPVLGFIADRHSKPWFIPLGVALAGCGVAIMGFMSSYWTIFAGIAASGIGSAFFHPEGARFANKVSGASKGIGISIFSIGGNGGFVIGPIMVALFVGNFGLHGMSVFGAIGLVMAALLLWHISRMSAMPNFLGSEKIAKADFPGQARFAAADPAGAEGDDLVGARTKNESEAKNNWREFSRLIVIIISRSMVFVGCNTFIPLYWVSALGQSEAAGATALVVFGGAGIVCNIIGGWTADRFGYVNVIRLAFCAMGPVVLAFSLANSLIISWILLPLLGFVVYFPFSSQVALGQKLLAKNIGFASGVTMGLATTIGGMMQPCLGWVADNHGLSAVFFILSFVGLVAAIFSFFLSRTENAG